MFLLDGLDRRLDHQCNLHLHPFFFVFIFLVVVVGSEYLFHLCGCSVDLMSDDIVRNSKTLIQTNDADMQL